MTQTQNNAHRQLPTTEFVGQLARTAGELTLRFFRSQQLRVDEKSGDLGLVTEADLASETLLKNEIAQHFPGHVFLGEETGWSEAVADGQVVWIIDPIDGTTNFSKGNIYYCISVACGVVESGRFRPERVAIFHPGTGDLYSAGRGQGATVNGVPMKVAAGTDPRRWSLATGFSSSKGEALRGVIECIERMQNRILGMRINGAAALDLSLTARGVFNGFFESRLSPWDMAAGALLVEEAGGLVVNYEGQPFDILRDANIVAGPAHVVRDMLDMISGVREYLRSTAWP
ncbi:MAG: inositol monophosphatase [Betaproteobacteria bacterium]|nr:inositol monophosphatase [Betaproteobacteria bacterium]